MEGAIPTSVFEGAGFTLRYNNNFILAKRIDRPELEYVGGKVEEGETPYQTARAELIEEIGHDILDADWKERAVPLIIFQPFSKKWIWNFLLDLTATEYLKLCKADVDLRHWDPAEKRSFEKLTGRTSLARKAVDGLFQVPVADVVAYVSAFADVEPTKNRMKDAKLFGETHSLTGVSVSGNAKAQYPLRGFNVVFLEQHLEKIKM